MSEFDRSTRYEASTSPGGGARLFAVRVINYLTNEIISHVPSFRLRHLWYRRVLNVAIGRGAGIHLGCYVWFYSPGQMRQDGLRIGAYTRINRGCCLDARGSITIGDNVSVSRDTLILSAYHLVEDPDFAVASRPVIIDDHVWIGARATIMPGVHVGRGAVVAAGAVVTRDVDPLTIVGGIPARPIGKRPETATHYVISQPLPLFE
jgi:maltose O-acetyltransferase